MRHILSALILVFGMLAASPASAIDYFVDGSCPTSGNGTTQVCGANGPWRDIAQARGVNGNPCAAGDTIRVKPAAQPYITTNQGGDPSETGGYFITCNAGTPFQPWRITAFDPLVMPQTANCALSSTSYSQCPRPTFSCQGAQHIEIDHLKIHGGIWCSGIQTTNEANLPRGLHVHHNDMTQGWGEVGDGNWSTFFCQGHHSVRFHHNFVHRLSTLTGGGQQSSMAGIKLFTCPFSTYEFNTIDGVTEPGTQSGCIDDKQDSIFNVHRFNLCINVPHGIRIQNQTNATYPYNTAAHDTIVENNVFEIVGSGNCLRLEGGGIASLTFRNNTCRGPFSGDGAFMDVSSGRGFSGVRVYNNIVMGSAKHVAFYGAGSSFAQLDYNVWDSATTNAFSFGGSNYSTLAAVVSGTAFEDHGLSMSLSTVGFVNVVGKDYHLAPGSPLQTACRVGGVPSGAIVPCGAYSAPSVCLGWTCGGTTPPPTGDTTAPVISLTVPTTGSPFTTTTSPLPLVAGTCQDNVGVASVVWALGSVKNTAIGTTAWSAANVPLFPGLNTFTAVCSDAAGNSASVALSITLASQPPPSDLCTPPDPTSGTVAAGLRTYGWCYPENADGGSPITGWVVRVDGMRLPVSAVTVGAVQPSGRRFYSTSITVTAGAHVVTVAAVNAIGEGTQSQAFALNVTQPPPVNTAPTGVPGSRGVN